MADLLDADLIHRSLGDTARQSLDSLDVLDIVPSTNTWLMQQDRHERGRFRAALAEHQTAGRGRQSKRWFSPPGSGVCLSLAYTFSQNPRNLSCLTLAAGVAVARALEKCGADTLKLKWPNDLYIGNAKLGGILTDAQTASGSRITMICGVGINVDLKPVDAGTDFAGFDYSVTDLRSHFDELPNRSVLAAAIIDQLTVTIQTFEQDGLDPFRADWNTRDWLRGKPIEVEMPDSSVHGTADGIDANGALRVMTNHGRRRVFTGTVRVAGGGPGAA
ncbi:MAG: biotin--[acetyl-CoA-carboxylase] ligase [Woeseiaceae bacterium]|nr:biotin--[acetyl-CoA-carboxylase] ligase [Woeseiaceae bacterium]